MSGSTASLDAVFADHRAAWAQKRALRLYYQREIFARVVAELRPGRTLEVGTGPGFFADFHPGMTGLDVESCHPGVVAGDAHAMPFADATFDNVAMIDVLHHLACPGRALGEMARVLAPAGRVVLVEPWTGPLGRLFYRYLHHEDCSPVADPWNQAFAPGKAAMDGNAMIPQTLLAARASELGHHAPLRLSRVEPFGIFSYAATGGFRKLGLPWPVIHVLCRIENGLSRRLRDFAALRALFVLERV
ncbi:MAG: class I SAM-dependent methyltransferase [Alphaproteobacteria bacterium]